jgi:hypothetical protein
VCEWAASLLILTVPFPGAPWQPRPVRFDVFVTFQKAFCQSAFTGAQRAEVSTPSIKNGKLLWSKEVLRSYDPPSSDG